MRGIRIIFLFTIALILWQPGSECHAQNTGWKKKELRDRLEDIRRKAVKAPELSGSYEWLNVQDPLSLKKLKGKVVLFDFWTYCCINCIHIIPDLKYLEEKYKDHPFVVIGVHSAKFDNEKDVENVRQAVLRYEIEHPVVLDQNFRIWQSYDANAWPTLILVDPDGYIAGFLSGEGHREILDAYVEVMLEKYGEEGKLDNSPIPYRAEKVTEESSILNYPGKIVADEKNNRLIMSDSNHNRLVVVDSKGAILDVIGSGLRGQKDGTFEQASFNNPQGMAFYKDALYVTDTDNHLVRRVDFVQRVVETVAGTGKQGWGGNEKTEGLVTQLNSPWDLCVVEDTAYIAMAGSHQIWQMDLKTNEVGNYAGSGREAKIDGPVLTAAFAQPSGITYGDGALYIADSEISSIRKIDLKNGIVSTIAGGDLFDFGDKDSQGEKTRLQHPLGVYYFDGLLYIADTYNHKIKSLNPTNEKTTTWLGDGKTGFRDGDKPRFYEPSGLVVMNNKLYVADTNNHAIRVVSFNSQHVSTLSVSDNRMGIPSLADLPLTEKRSLPPTTLALSGHLKVQINLPKNTKLNPGSPFQYLVKTQNSGVHIKDKNRIQSLAQDTVSFTIPYNVAKNGTTDTIQLEMVYYYCDNDGRVCRIRSVVYEFPVDFSNSGINELYIEDMPEG